MARWGLPAAAAGGRRRRRANTAAVEKIEGSVSLKIFSGTARRREAITRRSLVQILPPQPKIDKCRQVLVDFHLFTHFVKSIFGSEERGGNSKELEAGLGRMSELVRNFIAKVCSMEPERKNRYKPRSPDKVQ